MKICLSIILFFLAAFSGVSFGETPDIFVSSEAGFAVKINGEIVSPRRYNSAAAMILKEFEKSSEVDLSSENGKEILRLSLRSAIDEITDSVLIAQGAASIEITVGKDEIRNSIEGVKAGFPSSHEFHKSLADQGITVEDLTSDIKKQIIRVKLAGKLEQDIRIDEKEIAEFYKRNKNLFVQPERIRIRTITVNAKPEADEIEKGLKEGGDDRYVENEDLAPGVWEIISKLKPGDTSAVIRTVNVYQIIRVEEKLPPRELKLADARERIRGFLLTEKARSVFYDWLAELRSKAVIVYNDKLAWIIK